MRMWKSVSVIIDSINPRKENMKKVSKDVKASKSESAKACSGGVAAPAPAVKQKPAAVSGCPKYVYPFGKGEADGDASMRNELGGKGANLAEMSRLGLPVPAGFTITTECCNDYFARKAWPSRWTRLWPKWKPEWAASTAIPRTRCWSAAAPAPASPCLG